MAISPTPQTFTSGAPTPLPSPNTAAAQDRESRVDAVVYGNYKLMFRDQDWVIDPEGHIRPLIKPCSKTMGVNSNDPRNGGSFVANQRQHEANGYTFIEHDVLPGGRDYVVPYKTKKGRLTHRCVFEVPVLRGDGKTKFLIDRSAWDAFVRMLRAKGVIKPPQPSTIAGMITQKRSEMNHLVQPTGGDERMQRRYRDAAARLQRQLDSLESEMETSVKAFGELVAPAMADGLMAEMQAEIDAAEAGWATAEKEIAPAVAEVAAALDDSKGRDADESDDDIADEDALSGLI